MSGGARGDAAFDGAVHAEEGDDVLEVGFYFGGYSDAGAEGCEGFDGLVCLFVYLFAWKKEKKGRGHAGRESSVG